MITGDSQATGEAIAKQLNIEEVEGNVLPEEKARIIQEKQDKYGSIAMVGDGINDAPALTTADIGVAMGQGTDTAIDVADIVLMQNDLNSLTYAHRLARRMNRIIWQNIIFSLFVIVTLIVLNLMEKADITLGVILHEGSTIVVLFNSLRLLIPLDKE